MRVARAKDAHALAAETGRKAFGEGDDRLIVLLPAVETGLALVQRLGVAHMQANFVEAESRIERVGQALLPQSKQAQDVFGLASRRGGLDLDRAHRPVRSEEQDFERPPALATRAQRGARLLQQGRKRAFQSRDVEKRLRRTACGPSRQAAAVAA